MTSDQRAEFLKSRIGKIGGSDIGALLSNIIPMHYGCQRNLWARLSGVPEDNPGVETEPMILGTLCEPWIRRAYSDLTGRRVEQSGLKQHKHIVSLQYHDDGIVYPHPADDRKEPGVLEVKALGREMMQIVNEEGLAPEYICQLQNGLLCHGLEWGSFAVGMRENLLPLVVIELTAALEGNPMPILPRQPRIVHFEVERNAEICKTIENEVPRFMATIGDESKIPVRYDPESARCRRCPRKVWCHGPAILESIQAETSIPQRTDLGREIQEYRNAVAILGEAEELVREAENKFKAILGKQTAIQVPVTVEKDGRFEQKWKNILWRLSRGRETVDGRRMAASYDALRRAAIEAGRAAEKWLASSPHGYRCSAETGDSVDVSLCDCWKQEARRDMATLISGAELTPPSGKFISVGLPTRPLRLSGLLPPKEKKKGEVPEVDEDGGESDQP